MGIIGRGSASCPGATSASVGRSKYAGSLQLRTDRWERRKNISVRALDRYVFTKQLGINFSRRREYRARCVARMATGAKHRWISWLLLSLSLLLFVRMARTAQLSEVFALLRARGPILALSLCPYLLVLSLDAAGWRTLLSTLGRDVSPWRVFWVRTSTEAIHRSLPRGAVAAEAMKPYLLRESAAVPISETTASLAVSKALTA